MLHDEVEELARVEALRGTGLLDTPSELEFDEIVQLAAEICATPISLVSLVDSQRQWFKAVLGLSARETPRDVSFCSHAIRQPGLFIVEDATKDIRFSANALVTGDPAIRFYAGMPLETPDGHAIGTLCVIDTVPRHLTDRQERALIVLAKQVRSRMFLRMQRRALQAALEANEKISAGLRASEDRFRMFMDNSPFASFIKDEAGRMVFYNRQLAERFGVSRQAWIGKTDNEIWPSEIAAEFRRNDLAVLRQKAPIELAEKNIEPDGNPSYWQSYKFPFVDESGEQLIAGISIDVTADLERKFALEKTLAEKAQLASELEAANASLMQLVTIDSLTGIANRRAFDERLAIEFATAQRRNRPLSILIIDADRFKTRNDTYGHAAGDRVLRIIAGLLASAVRAEDLAARYGGEEFAILLPETEVHKALAFAERLRRKIAAEKWDHEPITVSIGIAQIELAMTNPSLLVESADEALYTAKRAGRDRIVIAPPGFMKVLHDDNSLAEPASGQASSTDTLASLSTRQSLASM